MTCSSCGAAVAADANFCGQCGTPVTWDCASCGRTSPAVNRFCEQCGTRREGADAPSDIDSDAGPPTGTPATATGESPVAATSEGERRHMTVMFCDLVGSTQMAEQFDPEELKAIVQAYQHMATEVIEDAGGYIGHYMGDGILAYFGYPIADPRASVRAVRAGLRLIAGIADLRTLHDGLDLRVGVHSGMTIVADMGAGDHRQLRDVVGETPNIAARVQGVAAPGTVAVSASAREGCEGFIDFRSLGEHALKGVSEQVEIFEPVGDTGAGDRLDLDAKHRRLTPLVGRDAELEQLVAAWRRTQMGDAQVFWITGEPGIGKTRLVRELIARVRADDGIEIDFRCSALHQSSSLYCAAEQFRRYLLADNGALSIQGCEALADANGTPRSIAVPVIAQLLGIPLAEPYRSLEGSADHVRSQMLDGVTRLVEDRARRQPVLVLIDDIQWIDSTSAELAERFIGIDQRRDVMTVVTSRASNAIDVPTAPHHQHIELERLGEDALRRIIEHVAGSESGVDAGLMAQIAERTEGIPLFAEELTHLMLTAAPDSDAVPTTLRDSLMARIDRLGREADVVRVLSIFGREAPETLLHAVTGLDRARFLADVEALIQAGLIVRRGRGQAAVYAFRHALQQEVAYESMLRSTRRTLHARVAQVLESRFVDRSLAEPEVSARHLELSGEVERALPYLLRAGDRAIAISAHTEALAHLHHALEIVEQMPPGAERDAHELDVLVRLGVPTTATRGYGSAEADAVYKRAEGLAEVVGDHEGAYHALYGLFRTRLLQAQYTKAADLGARLAELADAAPDRVERQVGAARALGSLGFYVGADHRATLAHLDVALGAPDAARPGAYLGSLNDVVDPIVTCRAYAAWAQWLTGNPKEARRLSDEAMTAARRLAHPFTLCLALCFDTWLCQFEGDARATVERAEEGMAVADAHGFPFWVGWAKVLRAWGHAQLGATGQAAEMRSGIEEWQAQGSALGKSFFNGLVAAVEADAGELDSALDSVEGALAAARGVGERFWEPELLRLKAEIVRAVGGAPDEVDALFGAAVGLAEAQGAVALAERSSAARRGEG